MVRPVGSLRSEGELAWSPTEIQAVSTTSTVSPDSFRLVGHDSLNSATAAQWIEKLRDSVGDKALLAIVAGLGITLATKQGRSLLKWLSRLLKRAGVVGIARFAIPAAAAALAVFPLIDKINSGEERNPSLPAPFQGRYFSSQLHPLREGSQKPVAQLTVSSKQDPERRINRPGEFLPRPAGSPQQDSSPVTAGYREVRVGRQVGLRDRVVFEPGETTSDRLGGVGHGQAIGGIVTNDSATRQASTVVVPLLQLFSPQPRSGEPGRTIEIHGRAVSIATTPLMTALAPLDHPLQEAGMDLSAEQEPILSATAKVVRSAFSPRVIDENKLQGWGVQYRYPVSVGLPQPALEVAVVPLCDQPVARRTVRSQQGPAVGETVGSVTQILTTPKTTDPEGAVAYLVLPPPVWFLRSLASLDYSGRCELYSVERERPMVVTRREFPSDSGRNRQGRGDDSPFDEEEELEDDRLDA